MSSRPPAPEQVSAPTHVALLRGINVGGKHLLPMVALAKMFTEAGCRGVTTYIQSGNVVFTASTALAKRLPQVVAERVTESFGFQPAVMIRSSSDIVAVATANPFLDPSVDPKTLFVGFLESTPTAAAIARIDPQRSPHDRFMVRGSEVYFHYTKRILESKFTNAYIDSVLKTSSTFRNWRTVTKLAEMVSAPAAPSPDLRKETRP